MTCFTEKIYFRCVKINILLFSSVILLNSFGCVAYMWQWQRDVVINGIHFEKFAYSSQRGGGKGFISEDTLVQNYPCKKGYVVFYDDWKLGLFQLSQSIKYKNNHLPANTWVRFDKEGHIRICTFPEDTEIQGYLCRGPKMGHGGFPTTFQKNGKLSGFFSREDVEIDGILCKGSGVVNIIRIIILLNDFYLIHLHDNGKLRSCTLAKTMTINGIEYKEKSKIKLDREGNVVSVE